MMGMLRLKKQSLQWTYELTHTVVFIPNLHQAEESHTAPIDLRHENMI